MEQTTSTAHGMREASSIPSVPPETPQTRHQALNVGMPSSNKTPPRTPAARPDTEPRTPTTQPDTEAQTPTPRAQDDDDALYHQEPYEAIATTKRKFDRLLESITNPKPPPIRDDASFLASPRTTLAPENPRKKYRLSDIALERMERERGTKRQVSGEKVKALQEKLLAGRRSVRHVRGPRGESQSEEQALPKGEPNFQPHSQDQFLARLKTFADVKKWSAKPDAINEVEWAKRGWVCEEWNTVACAGGCEARLVIKLRPKRRDAEGKEIDMSEDVSEDINEGLVERYRELIIDAHTKDCLWRKLGSPDDIFHIDIAKRAWSTQELLTRYRSFTSIASELPPLSSIAYPDPSSSTILKYLDSAFFNPPGSEISTAFPTSPSDIAAFTFSIFGWAAAADSTLAIANCKCCHQRIGLWLYKEERLNEMAARLEVDVAQLRLNLVESHREYCPWKDWKSQSHPRGTLYRMAAWQSQQFMLLGRKWDPKNPPPMRRKPVTPRTPIATSTADAAEAGMAEHGQDGDMQPETEEELESIDDIAKNADKLIDTWRKLKYKLKRSASKKSVKSVKSAKSSKSSKSLGFGLGRDKEKENEEDRTRAN